MKKPTVFYPTPGCQHSTGEPVAATVYVSYLSEVLASLTEEERSCAVISGTFELKITGERFVPELEVAEDKVKFAREWAERLKDGARPEDVEFLLSNL